MRKLCRRKGLVPLAFAALAAFIPNPAIARTCDLDMVPAATLLLPYFEVDVSTVTPPLPPRTIDTFFAVFNTSTVPRIAHVTLWTEWAIPTASFDLPLGGYDEKSINVIELFIEGAPLGSFPMSFNHALGVTGQLEDNLEKLRKAHTGVAMTTPTGTRVASSSHPTLAKGYITIDVVRERTVLFPSDPPDLGYFRDGGTGIATNDNVLSGDYFLVDNTLGTAFGEPMVHIRADRTFRTGDYTFYGRYVGGTAIDDRQPLGSLYANRFFTSYQPDPLLSPATFLIVWRDTKSPAAIPVLAGFRPAWFPIPLRQILGCDEDEVCSFYRGSLPLATQKTAINLPGGLQVPYGAGWMRLNLNHQRTTLFGASAQGYVTTIFNANLAGSMRAVTFRATRLQTPCRP
jgi:hypothetical protein